jgi:hypothetical protein
VQDLGIPELTSEQIEGLCVVTEEAARKYVYSKVPKKRIETLSISVEVEGTKPVNLKVDIDIGLPSSMDKFNVPELADKAVKKAFKSAQKYLRELTCRSWK